MRVGVEIRMEGVEVVGCVPVPYHLPSVWDHVVLTCVSAVSLNARISGSVLRTVDVQIS